MVFVLFFADPTLAAVTAYELTSAAEFVDGKTAVIGTSMAVGHSCGIFQFIDLLNGKHGGFFAFLITLPGDKGSTKSTHNTGNIRTDGFTVCNTLEAAEYGIVIEGSTLYYDMASKLCCIGNFDNLIKGVFDNRVGKTCGNICNRCAFLLGLLYFRVHENRTSCTQVNGVLCKKSGFCEILYRIVQGFGKGFNKGAAA